MWKNVTSVFDDAGGNRLAGRVVKGLRIKVVFDDVGGNWLAGRVVKGLRIKVGEYLFIGGNKTFKLSQDLVEALTDRDNLVLAQAEEQGIGGIGNNESQIWLRVEEVSLHGELID